MKKRLNVKKIVSWILVSVVIMGCMDMLGIGKDIGTVYAAEEAKSYFLEGYATGKAFDSESESWTIKTIPSDNLDDKYKTDTYKAGIVANNHSATKEKVMRLINGVEYETMSSPGNDHRAGVALMNPMVKLGEEGQFSVKFTFSMPDTCRRTNNGYKKDAGGDGIVFLIAKSDTKVEGATGGGIGYQGIAESVGVEFDSFYNVDDGQGIFDPDYTGAYTFDENTYNNTKYKRDHIAVVTGGVNTTPDSHIGTTFLVNTAGYEKGFAQEGDLAVEGEDVDNNLFTAWVEFDGANLYVHCVRGDFQEANRADSIALTVNEPKVIEQLKKFGGEDVKVGFTAAIGGSKANHTIHSVAIVNEYLANGIQTPYIEKYYVEDPNATDADNPIIIDGKKYVLYKEHAASGSKGASVSIAPILGVQEGLSDKHYTAVAPAVSGYPNSATISADGTTVLYQFFDEIPHTHEWEYTADKNVITGECIEDMGMCDVDTTGKDIILNAGDFEYTGYPYTGGSVTDGLTAITGGTLGEIYYEGTGETSYNKTTVPPIDVGTYKATVSIGGAVAEMEFVIHKPHVHDWTPFETVKEPTETEEGLRESHCKNNCGYKQTEIIPPLNATWEKDHSPKTGDVEDNSDWLSLMIGSGIAVLFAGVMVFKKKD